MKLNRIGAEAQVKEIIINSKKFVSKKRIPKKYRHKELDLLIRKKRTKSESKLISKLYNKINVPKIISVDEKNCEIIMTFVQGKMLKEIIEKQKELCVLAGQEIKKIHEQGIIHGDLTTSNIIYKKEKTINKNNKNKLKKKNGKQVNCDFAEKLYFIDFGLGYFSQKIEDKATDLILFKKTFNATHSNIKNGWQLILKGYDPNKEMLDRMGKIEKRARYL